MVLARDLVRSLSYGPGLCKVLAFGSLTIGDGVRLLTSSLLNILRSRELFLKLRRFSNFLIREFYAAYETRLVNSNTTGWRRGLRPWCATTQYA